MRYLSLVAALSVALSSALVPAPAAAAEAVVFDKAGGWEIARTPDFCVMQRSYKDKSDGDALNTVMFVAAGKDLVVTLSYEHWKWEGGAARTLPLLVDGRVVADAPTWKGEGEALAGKFQEGIVPVLADAKSLGVRLPDGDAEFEVENFKDGYAALRRCEDARAVPVPPEADSKTYLFGRLIESTLRECEVAGATARDLAAVQDRLAAMRPRMAPVEATLSAMVDKREQRCLPGAGSKDFKELVALFLEKPPAEFVAIFARRHAEEKAKAAGAKP